MTQVPPFNINEALPAGSDQVSAYPAAEQLYRDIVESWLSTLSDPTTGKLKAGSGFGPTEQVFLTGGTWTKPAGCRFIIIEAAGGGGGGGGVDGQGAGTCGAGGGGATGHYGKTGLIDVSAVSSATVNLGAGGVGVVGAAGTNGGDTTITIGATTYTWPGGGAAGQVIATTSNHKQGFPGGTGTAGTNVIAYSLMGGFGFSSVADNNATGGMGGRIPGWSGAGYAAFQQGSGSLTGVTATGNGGGGGGGAVALTTTNVAGGDGRLGFMKFTEIY